MRTFGRTSEQRWYRVEHRSGTIVRALGQVADLPRHSATLDPWLSHLLREGAQGELYLVDEETGEVVARRTVSHSRRMTERLRTPPTPIRRLPIM